jgi:hypothetical protein
MRGLLRETRPDASGHTIGWVICQLTDIRTGGSGQHPGRLSRRGRREVDRARPALACGPGRGAGMGSCSGTRSRCHAWRTPL